MPNLQGLFEASTFGRYQEDSCIFDVIDIAKIDEFFELLDLDQDLKNGWRSRRSEAR